MIISRYLGRCYLQAVCVVGGVLALINGFVNLLNEIDSLGRGHYTLWQAFSVALLSLPQSVYQFFPMIGLLSVLFALGRLAQHNELIMLQGSGLSTRAILCRLLPSLLLVIVGATLLGEGVAPWCLQRANSLRQRAMFGHVAKTSSLSAWQRVGNTFIHYHVGSATNSLHQVQWFRLDKDFQLNQAGQAKRAQYDQTQRVWNLYQAQWTNFSGLQVIDSGHKAQTNGLSGLQPDLLHPQQWDPQAASLLALAKQLHWQRVNHLDPSALSGVFWQRVFAPLSALMMMLLGSLFVFGPLRQVTMGVRFVSGLACGFVFYFANQMLDPLFSVWQWPAWLGALLPSLLVGLGWGVLCRLS